MDPWFGWVCFPVIVWSGFGLSSLIVYFAQLGGPVPAWVGILGVSVTVACGTAAGYGVVLGRRSRWM